MSFRPRSNVSASQLALAASVWDSAGKLRQLLAIIDQLRQLKDPLSSEAGLRQGIELVLAVGEFVGIESAWLNRLRQILSDPAVFAVVLAIVRYFSSLLDEPPISATSDEAPVDAATLDAQAIADWLPIVIDLVRLWRALRGTA